MPQKKKGRGKAKHNETPEDTMLLSSSSDDESPQMKPSVKRARKDGGGNKENKMDVPVALPKQDQRVTRGMAKRLAAAGLVNRKTELIQQPVVVKRKKKTRPPMRTEETFEVEPPMEVDVPELEPIATLPVEVEPEFVSPVSTKLETKVKPPEPSRIPDVNPPTRVECTPIPNESEASTLILDDTNSVQGDGDMPTTPTTPRPVNSEVFHSVAEISGHLQDASIYETPIGKELTAVAKESERRRLMDSTYVIRHADYDEDSNAHDDSMAIFDSSKEYSYEERKDARDNYNITRFEEYDADGLTHRRGKSHSKWAGSGENVDLEAFLCRPDLMKQASKSKKVGPGFPPANPKKQLFPNAEKRRPELKSTKQV